MVLQKKVFTSDNTREKIQTLIDIDIFKMQTKGERILEYLENPYKIIEEKYINCYQLSWENLKLKYATEHTAYNILNQFYELIATLKNIFDSNELDDSKKMFSDLF